MPKINLPARFQFWKEIYIRGWRWVVFIVWSLPYAGVAFYDFLVGQGFLSEDTPKVSQIIPDWGYYTWFGIGIILFIAVTLEGSYHYFNRIKNDYDRDIRRLSERQTGNETTVAVVAKQKRINAEIDRRKPIYDPIRDILVRLRSKMDALTAAVDVSVLSQQGIKAVERHMLVYIEKEKDLIRLDLGAHDEFLRELRHRLDEQGIGVAMLIEGDSETREMVTRLHDIRQNIESQVLNDKITEYLKILYNTTSAELFRRYKSPERIWARVLRGREDMNERLNSHITSINAHIGSILLCKDVI